MHGLAMVIIFGRIIIQCEGNWIAAGYSRTETEDLMQDLWGFIFGKTDLETVKNTLKEEPLLFSPEIAMNGLLENRIVLIDSAHFIGGIKENCRDDEIFLEFGSYRSLESFFEKFGNKVKKIKIDYDSITDHVLLEAIPNFIQKCANNLNELHITSFNNEGVWIKLGKDNICPEVKKIKIDGFRCRIDFKLNSIFPKLESAYVFARMNVSYCMAGVKTLKEFELMDSSIESDEDGLISVFGNNTNMRKINLFMPKKSKTIESIAKNLMKLETLQVGHPKANFLFRADNQELLYNLSSVTDFYIELNRTEEIVGELSFDMPHLKTLKLSLNDIDTRIIGFIERFKELKALCLLLGESISPLSIEIIRQELMKSTWTLMGADSVGTVKYLWFRRQSFIDWCVLM